MIHATVITKGLFSSRNGRGFLLPLIRNLSNLEAIGVKLNIQYSLDKFRELESDVVIIESQAIFHLYKKNYNRLVDMLGTLKTKANRIIFFDINDDTGTAYFDLLPYVDKYSKSYVFRDRTLYKQDLYGGRLWTDYYHRMYGIEDDSIFVNHPISNDDDLNKISVGYLSGLVDYSGNSTLTTNGRFLDILRRTGLLKYFLKNPSSESFVPPSASRDNPVSCRIKLEYSRCRETITFHRKEIAEILGDRLKTNKLPKKQYLSELQNSRIVISPFGWGELNCPRDYEVPMSGAILMKPNIQHLETFPNIFTAETVVQFKWDFSDLIDKLNETLDNYDHFLQFANRLQEKYKFYMCTEESMRDFCHHFKNILVD